MRESLSRHPKLMKLAMMELTRLLFSPLSLSPYLPALPKSIYLRTQVPSLVLVKVSTTSSHPFLLFPLLKSISSHRQTPSVACLKPNFRSHSIKPGCQISGRAGDIGLTRPRGKSETQHKLFGEALAKLSCAKSCNQIKSNLIGPHSSLCMFPLTPCMKRTNTIIWEQCWNQGRLDFQLTLTRTKVGIRGLLKETDGYLGRKKEKVL